MKHVPASVLATGFTACLAAMVLAPGTPASALPAPAPTPVPVTEQFPYSGQQESWTVPEGITTITVTVAGASGYGYPGHGEQTPRAGGDGGLVETELTVTPGTELLLLAGQHPDQEWISVVGNRTDTPAYPGGGGSFLAANDHILIAAGGGGGASRNWLLDKTLSANGGDGGFADGEDGGPDATYGGQGATVSAPGANGATDQPDDQKPPATSPAHVAAGEIVPGFGGSSSINVPGSGGGGYFGGGAGGRPSIPDDEQGDVAGSGGGGSGYLAPPLTPLSTGTNTGNGYITIEYQAVPPTITGPATAAATIGQPFSYTPSITGLPDPTVTLTDGTLPEGLTLDPETGEISGTPQDEAGDYPVTLHAETPGTPPATLELTIQLSVVTFTATFDMNGHGTAPEPATAPRGEPITEPTAPTATDWTFTGWYTDAAATDAYDFTTGLTADVTLYAGWEAVTPDPTPSPSEPDQVSADDQGGSSDSLPVTGAESVGLLAAGIAVSLLGVALLFARRKHRS